MQKKPILVVLAAGMGSRYGGLKQIDPVGPSGEVIMDYSLYDAKRAGFETVVFIIKHEIEERFKSAIGDRLSKVMDVRYAFQELDDLPEGYAVPAGRVKPWGTCHAMLAARHVVDGPFAVINADDCYGPAAFRALYAHLTSGGDEREYAMAGYRLENTVTENGSVARGVCAVDGGLLREITERTRIERRGGGICYTDDGQNWLPLSPDTVVSMNIWGFQRNFMDAAWKRFPAFLERALRENPLKAEYFLPYAVEQLLGEGQARVRVLPTPDRWYGVTYREDKPLVVSSLARLTAAGTYPENLWA